MIIRAIVKRGAFHSAAAITLTLAVPACGRQSAEPAGVPTASQQATDQRPLPTGRNVPAVVKDIATDALDQDDAGDTEPSIAVNPADPREIAIVAFSEPWGSDAKAPVWRSSDAGATWTKTFEIPEIASGFAGPADQKIAFTSDGRLVLAELGVDADRVIQNRIMREPAPQKQPLVIGIRYGDDQPHVDVDRVRGSSCFERIYSPWLNTKDASKSMVSVSGDGGTSVTDVIAGDKFPNRTTRLAVSPSGSTYVLYKTREGAVDADFEHAHFVVKRSDDCGATWPGLGTSGVSVHGVAQVVTYFTTHFGNPAKGKTARARSSDGWIAAGESGLVAAAYVNKDASGFAQVFAATSSDRGATWIAHRVTDGTHNSAFPEIAVAANGALGVLYIDYDDAGEKTVFRHHFARSFDNGVKWSDEILQAMDPSGLDNAGDGYLWGDYEGLTALGSTFYGVFTGASIGRRTPQLDPLFFTQSAVR